MKEHTHRREGRFEFSGGDLALDFANVVGGPPERADLVHTYSDLLDWTREAGVLGRIEARALEAEARRRPSEAAAVMDEAMRLQEAIWRVFSAVAAGQAPPPDQEDRLGRALAEALAHVRLVREDGGYRWDWAAADGPPLERVLWPVAHAAGELLRSDKLDAVRECASDTCSWLFVDRSRNRSRRWCDMRDCGNRAKARRHYERTRARRPAEGEA